MYFRLFLNIQIINYYLDVGFPDDRFAPVFPPVYCLPLFFCLMVLLCVAESGFQTKYINAYVPVFRQRLKPLKFCNSPQV
jgi:hypothetical protein